MINNATTKIPFMQISSEKCCAKKEENATENRRSMYIHSTTTNGSSLDWFACKNPTKIIWYSSHGNPFSRINGSLRRKEALFY